MAYTTTQIIDQLKVDNLIFVPSNNQNISSGYSLYINATGQLYWAAALDANSLSTFSTSVYNYINYNNAIFRLAHYMDLVHCHHFILKFML
jgi:hypothetical protein